MSTASIKALLQEFLSSRPHKAGETIQFGWFIFQIAQPGPPPRIESLDFRRMASFTEDFSEAERIHAAQKDALGKFNATETDCTLWQSALVSVSYSPGHADAFLKRDRSMNGNDSGWYVGVFDDPADMSDVASFSRRSLYELTIHDERMAPFWLFPVGTVVSLATGIPAHSLR